jgi:hypothetical protein
MMPTMAGLFFAGAVYRYSKGGPFEQLLYGGFASLMCSGILLREVGSGMCQFVEEYLERNGVLRKQLRTCIDINSTEGIISAVEAGLGIGFAPCLAIEKALKLGSVKAVHLDNGPIRRQLSIALLSGPDPRGPVGRLLELLREHGAAMKRISLMSHASDEPTTKVVKGTAQTGECQGAIF